MQLTPTSARGVARMYDDLEERDLSFRREWWVDRDELVATVEAETHWALAQRLEQLRVAVAEALDFRVPGLGPMIANIDTPQVQNALIDGQYLRLLVVLGGLIDVVNDPDAAAGGAVAPPDSGDGVETPESAPEQGD